MRSDLFRKALFGGKLFPAVRGRKRWGCSKPPAESGGIHRGLEARSNLSWEILDAAQTERQDEAKAASLSLELLESMARQEIGRKRSFLAHQLNDNATEGYFSTLI